MAVGPSIFAGHPVTDGGDGGKRHGARIMDRVDGIEERVAHLQRAVDDLSDVVAAQRHDIDRLNRLVGLLVDREAEREAMAGETPAANVRPPHW
ncbi:MAG: SlyX family protein [Paracoccaceae bacterium]